VAAAARSRAQTSTERGRRYRQRNKEQEYTLTHNVILLHQEIAQLREACKTLHQRALLTRASPHDSLVLLARELYTVMQFGLETAEVGSSRRGDVESERGDEDIAAAATEAVASTDAVRGSSRNNAVAEIIPSTHEQPALSSVSGSASSASCVTQDTSAVSVDARSSTTARALSAIRRKEDFLRRALDPDVVYGDLRGVEAIISQWRKHTAAYSKFRVEIGDAEVVYSAELNASASSARTTCRCGCVGATYVASSDKHSTAHDGVRVKHLNLGDTKNRDGEKLERTSSGNGSGDDGSGSSDDGRPGTSVGSWLDNISDGSDDVGTGVGDTSSCRRGTASTSAISGKYYSSESGANGTTHSNDVNNRDVGYRTSNGRRHTDDEYNGGGHGWSPGLQSRSSTSKPLPRSHCCSCESSSSIPGMDASNPIVAIHTTLHARFSRESLPTMFPFAPRHRPDLIDKLADRDVEFSCLSRFEFTARGQIRAYHADINFVEVFVSLLGSAHDAAELMFLSVLAPHATLVDPHEREGEVAQRYG
jgi:hypothetical protein